LENFYDYLVIAKQKNGCKPFWFPRPEQPRLIGSVPPEPPKEVTTKLLKIKKTYLKNTVLDGEKPGGLETRRVPKNAKCRPPARKTALQQKILYSHSTRFSQEKAIPLFGKIEQR
jgi:hypothetical protein